MKRPTLAFAVFVALLGVAGSAKADTLEFSFISTPNPAGTYVDAYGTLTGNVTYFPADDPTDLDVLMVDSGTITVVSNVPPTPYPSGSYPRTPELNGYSDISWSNGGFLFSDSITGVNVTEVSTIASCPVCFLMAGNPADGGNFTFEIIASGVNGAPDNSSIDASDDGAEGYYYSIDGTLSLYGQVGNYDLTPEPPSWLLLGSGIVLLGFLFYRRSIPASNAL